MVDAVNAFLPVPFYKTGTATIKPARPDIIIQDEAVPADVMEDMVFEEIGGEEILSVARNDIINSPFSNVYQPIKNARGNSEIPDLLTVKVLTTKLTDYIPKTANVINVESGKYSVDLKGRIVINLINITDDQNVEIQVYGASTYYNDTIYGGA